MQIIAVKDANILIDCVDIDLLDAVFQLPVQFRTTDFIWAEILQAHQQGRIQAFIDAGQLSIVGFTAAEVVAIDNLQQQYSGISFEDSSALYLAQKESAFLLTGDGKLRKVCQANQIPVYGIIWLLDEALRLELISVASACTKIQQLQRVNPRLPKHALQQRIAQWCQP